MNFNVLVVLFVSALAMPNFHYSGTQEHRAAKRAAKHANAGYRRHV